MNSVPFTISNIHGGFAEAPGIARLEGNAIALSFQVQDFVGVTKGQVQDVQISLDVIDAVVFKKDLFAGRLFIRPNTMHVLADIPGAHKTELKLNIKRKYRKEAERFASAVSLRLSEHHLKRLNDEMDRLDSAQ